MGVRGLIVTVVIAYFCAVSVKASEGSCDGKWKYFNSIVKRL